MVSAFLLSVFFLIIQILNQTVISFNANYNAWLLHKYRYEVKVKVELNGFMDRLDAIKKSGSLVQLHCHHISLENVWLSEFIYGQKEFQFDLVRLGFMAYRSLLFI